MQPVGVRCLWIASIERPACAEVLSGASSSSNRPTSRCTAFFSFDVGGGLPGDVTWSIPKLTHGFRAVLDAASASSTVSAVRRTRRRSGRLLRPVKVDVSGPARDPVARVDVDQDVAPGRQLHLALDLQVDSSLLAPQAKI